MSISKETCYLLTAVAMIAGGGFAGDALSDVMADYSLEASSSEASEQINQSMQREFNDLITQKAALSALVDDQARAYARDDQALINQLEDQISEGADALEQNYEGFVVTAYTNNLFSEQDFYDLAKRAEDNGFPSEISKEGMRISFEAADARYLDELRENKDNQFKPMAASFENASRIDREANGRRSVAGAVSFSLTALSIYFMVVVAVGPRSQKGLAETLVNGLWRRKEQKKKLGQN